MRIQLWSYNYDPEPTGIGPLSTVWARAMRDRGHEVEVVAAHPHYPAPVWGHTMRPYREWRDGIAVLRLPLWPGRGSTIERVRQELSYSVALSCVLPMLKSPDVIVAVSPSFPALGPAMAFARRRQVPWVLWLQDILPDGAQATGLLNDGPLVSLARRFERAAYRSAQRVVVLSESFANNLRAKGVPEGRLARIFNPASQPIQDRSVGDRQVDPGLVLTMGNVGHTQNLVNVTRAFEASPELAALGARLVIAGDGIAGRDVRASIVSDRVQLTGVLERTQLERYLLTAAVGLVSQRYEGSDFNVPSKLMNFMGYGLPILAAVRADSEVARIVTLSGSGWVVDRADPAEFSEKLASALRDAGDRHDRGERALSFAKENFAPASIAEQFEMVLEDVRGRR